MDEETQEQLRELIENKNYFGAEELLSEQAISPELKALFLKLPELFGDIRQIRQARSMTDNPRAIRAIERLERVQEILDAYGLGDYVSYDLGMLSRYSYYTGIIFMAYTYGTGEYVVTGGRYDKLLEQFGKKAPAVGFAIVVDRLLLALNRQKIEIPVQMVNTILLYDHGARMAGIQLAGHFRNNGLAVQLVRRRSGEDVESYLEWARRQKVRNVLYLPGQGEQVIAYQAETGQSDVLQYSDYIS